MRKQFFDTIERLALQDDKIVFLTGDVGFNAIEPLQKAIGKRVINCGVAEQNMVSMAAGMASQGLKPIVYSIAPFVTHRVAEQLKIDVCLHNMNVKIVGNGGGYGYGIMGATHHAIEDIALMSSLQNMRCYVPFCNEQVESITSMAVDIPGPSYLRLGYWQSPYGGIKSSGEIHQIDCGQKATIVGMGPVIANAINLNCDVFAVCEIPFKINLALFASITTTNKLIIIEEHVRRGGLGEYLVLELMKQRIYPNQFHEMYHLHANGYPNNLYGSQAYHQQINGLDTKSIEEVVNGI